MVGLGSRGPAAVAADAAAVPLTVELESEGSFTENEQDAEDGDEESSVEATDLRPVPCLGQPKRLFGTHHHGSARTWLSSAYLRRYAVAPGLSLPGATALLLWLAFLAVALWKHFGRAWPLGVLTLAVMACQFMSVDEGCFRALLGSAPAGLTAWGRRGSAVARWAIVALLSKTMVVIVAIQVLKQSPARGARMQSLLGLLSFIGLCVAFSRRVRNIPWTLVISALVVQFYLGVFVTCTTAGTRFFTSLGNSVTHFLGFQKVGAGFLFEDLHCFAFNVLPTVIFFSAFISVMYYLGVLQLFVRALAVSLKFAIGTSLVQSVNAAGNLFLGTCESALLVKPFLAKASHCDLHSVMTGGFASIAGGVLAAFVGMGVKPEQLLGASVMSVPGTLLVSNLICPPGSGPRLEPEDDAEAAEEDGAGDGEQFYFPPPSENNVIEAAGNGAHIGIDLVLNIGAMLVAFLSIVAALDALLGYLGGLVDVPDLSFKLLCSYGFWPVAWLLGAPVEDCFKVGRLIGTKVFVNEFVAYKDLVAMTKPEHGPPLLSQRAELVATYALCGFSNFGSIGIALGGLTSLCPQRSGDIARLALSAMISGNVVCFITATMAGILH